MYEYQAVRVHYVGRGQTVLGIGYDQSGGTQIPDVFVDARITDVINIWARDGWELYTSSLAGTEAALHALLVFRRALR
jgi:hypothetical protein